MIKRIIYFNLFYLFLGSIFPILAYQNYLADQGVNQGVKDVFGPIPVPSPLSNGAGGQITLGAAIGNLINIFYVFSAIVLLFMLLLSGFEWMTSAGDKEKLAKARARITNALIGIVIIAAAFFITNQLILPAAGLNKIIPNSTQPANQSTTQQSNP